VIDGRQWRAEPALAAGLIIAGWLYAMLAGPLRARLAPGQPFPRTQARLFYGGLALFLLAVNSPFGRAGMDYLFTVHMAQSLVIMYPVAVLVLIGIPGWLADAALSLPAVRGIAAWLFRVPVCGGIFVLVVTGLHMPRVYEWGLESPAASALEHFALLGASLFFWWPLANPSGIRPPGSFAGRMVYLFCVEVALTALFTYLLMADHAVYPSYQFAPRLIPGVSATDDQVLGGILLSAVSSLVLLGALGLSFRRWAHADKHAFQKPET